LKIENRKLTKVWFLYEIGDFGSQCSVKMMILTGLLLLSNGRQLNRSCVWSNSCYATSV
jgi:hypothetical protein